MAACLAFKVLFFSSRSFLTFWYCAFCWFRPFCLEQSSSCLPLASYSSAVSLLDTALIISYRVRKPEISLHPSSAVIMLYSPLMYITRSR